jgi:membrane-anchored protein YejM (alkaline phosphatase superfamily)
VAPFFAAAFNRAKNRYFSEMALNIQALIENEASNMNGKFVFVHHSVPHMPLIFDRNGFIGKPERTAPLTVKAYLGNLRYIDTLIGRFLDSNTCDDFVWILTSDHSFRFDPDNKGNESETSPTRHVPLLIHFPGQTARHDVNEVLFLKDLKPLLAELSQNGFNPTQTAILQKWVAEKKEARE